MYQSGIFIFRRDLRLEDNLALIEAHKKCKNVHLVFIYTPEQIDDGNKYRSNEAICFMNESLEELHQHVKAKNGILNLYYGSNIEVLDNILNKNTFEAVFFNADITPYAIKRDRDIRRWCKDHDIECITCQDYYLYEPDSVISGTGTHYQKFTPYYRKVLPVSVALPVPLRKYKIANRLMKTTQTTTIKTMSQAFPVNFQRDIKGGRKNALKMLRKLMSFSNYGDKRNDLSSPTTKLSAFIKFGNVSIREVYHQISDKLGKNSDLLRQLIWRDFYAQLLYKNPHVLGKSLKPKYDGIKWNKNLALLNAWKNGHTGFPIVDAGMRELNTTGYMHNRARLITASFLIKTLLIDWREGEKYFASKLVDYDPASNNGNWQWVASTGADSQPYFRIFNPWSQSLSYDPDAAYIKKWIPELENVDPNDIHRWDEIYQNYGSINYPQPIVNYKNQREKALLMYKKVV